MEYILVISILDWGACSLFVIENNFHTHTYPAPGDAEEAGFLAEKYLVNYSLDCTAINKLLKYLNQLDPVLVFGAIKY